MITKNNWLTTNIYNRLNDPSCDFKIQINPYPFQKMDFNRAVDYTINEITQKHSNLYLGLSGGYDSDFVMHAFCERNVPITPIIIKCNSEKENVYAYKTCEKFKINPIILEVTEDELLDVYANYILGPANSPAYNSSQNIILSKYVNENKGTLLLGEHLLGDGDNIIDTNEFAFSNEWDFYWAALFPELPYIDFFLHTIELTYSAFPFNDTGIMWKTYKSKLFSLEKRDKIKPEWSKKSLEKIYQLSSKRPARPKTGVRYSLQDIHNIFDKYTINI